MAQEPFLVNPPRRRKRRARRVKRNTWFGHPAKHRKAAKKGWRKRRRNRAVVAAAPVRRRRQRSAAAAPVRRRRRRASVRMTRSQVRRRSRVRARDVAYFSNRPRRRRRMRRNPYMTVAGANPRRSYRRRYRRNPMLGGMNIMKNLPYVLTGALSATAQVVVPGFVPAQFQSPMVKLAVQAAVAVGGGMIVNKIMKDKMHGTVWMVTGGAVILAEVIKIYVLPNIPFLSDYTMSDYEVGGDGEAEMLEAFPGESLGADVSDFSAFPNSAVSF